MNLVSQPRRRTERGYILLTLMLFVALLTIGLLALVQNIESQIKRDREEELIHRGVQYSRAVKHYFRKFGRYPTRFEDLENTNNYRALRKRYKDPITGKDFKPLHMTDVQMSFASGVPGGGLPAAGLNPSPAGGLNGTTPNPGGAVQDPTTAQNAQGGDQSGAGDQPNQAATGANPQASQQGGSSITSNQLTSQTFGGGPIVGVASISKDKTIREFNKKDHYNQWQFIYDQSSDRGGLLMTPNQPPLKGAVQVNPANGTQTPPAQNPTPGTVQQPGQGNGPMQPNPQPPDQ
jgi:type II secretory pathway pseudopilin PulG